VSIVFIGEAADQNARHYVKSAVCADCPRASARNGAASRLDSHEVNTRSHRARPLPHPAGAVQPITAARIPAEIIAGITLAAIAIPEVMGYTKISGTPVITGLYTMLIPTMISSSKSGRDQQLGTGEKVTVEMTRE